MVCLGSDIRPSTTRKRACSNHIATVLLLFVSIIPYLRHPILIMHLADDCWRS